MQKFLTCAAAATIVFAIMRLDYPTKAAKQTARIVYAACDAIVHAAGGPVAP